MAVDVRTNRLILFATSIGAVLSPLIGSMIVLAMPEIGVAFGVVARDLGWLSTIFILANAIFLIPAARLSDLLGISGRICWGRWLLRFPARCWWLLPA